MSSYLKYFEKYEEKGNIVLFYLKDFPSSKIAGNKIVRELYIYLFHDNCQLERIHEIDELIFLVEKEFDKKTPPKSKVFSIRVGLNEENISKKLDELKKRIDDYQKLN